MLQCSKKCLDSYNIDSCSFPKLVRHSDPLLPVCLTYDSRLNNHACVCSSGTSFGQCTRVDYQHGLNDLFVCQHVLLPNSHRIPTLTVPGSTLGVINTSGRTFSISPSLR